MTTSEIRVGRNGDSSVEQQPWTFNSSRCRFALVIFQIPHLDSELNPKKKSKIISLKSNIEMKSFSVFSVDD